MNIDLFNSHKLAQTIADKNNLTRERDSFIQQNGVLAGELGSLAVKHGELQKKFDELQKEHDRIVKSEENDSRITFFVDKDMLVRLETKINKDIIDKLVADGYIAEKDISNETAIHLAFLVIANELTDQMIASYEGSPIDEAELRGNLQKEPEQK